MAIGDVLHGFDYWQQSFLCKAKSQAVSTVDKMHRLTAWLRVSLTTLEIVAIGFEGQPVREQWGGEKAGHKGFTAVSQEGMVATQNLRKVCLKH